MCYIGKLIRRILDWLIFGGEYGERLETLETGQEILMSLADDFRAKLEAANATTTNLGNKVAEVAADIADIKSQLSGAINARDAKDLSDRLDAHNATLGAVAVALEGVAAEHTPEPPAPAPEPEPTPES